MGLVCMMCLKSIYIILGRSLGVFFRVLKCMPNVIPSQGPTPMYLSIQECIFSVGCYGGRCEEACVGVVGECA